MWMKNMSGSIETVWIATRGSIETRWLATTGSIETRWIATTGSIETTQTNNGKVFWHFPFRIVQTLIFIIQKKKWKVLHHILREYDWQNSLQFLLFLLISFYNNQSWYTLNVHLYRFFFLKQKKIAQCASHDKSMLYRQINKINKWINIQLLKRFVFRFFFYGIQLKCKCGQKPAGVPYFEAATW